MRCGPAPVDLPTVISFHSHMRYAFRRQRMVLHGRMCWEMWVTTHTGQNKTAEQQSVSQTAPDDSYGLCEEAAEFFTIYSYLCSDIARAATHTATFQLLASIFIPMVVIHTQGVIRLRRAVRRASLRSASLLPPPPC
jgi:hypothetical protein